MAIYLGIDGGGSQTTCALGDERAVLATARAGGSNIIRVGEERAREALHSAIRQACATAGVDPAQVERACVGVAGAARPEVSAAIRRIVAEMVSGPVEVAGDMVIALEAAFGSGPGVVVIAGTGSIAYGRDARGQTARAGGWGFAISDEGSGHWIGRTAIAAALRACDEGEDPKLLGVLLNAWHLTSSEQLVRAANASPPDFSQLFPHVLAAAEGGDALARTVLTQAGTELAGLAKIVVRRLFPEAESVPVAMAGSVFRHAALVRQVFYNSLRSEYPQAAVSPAVAEPVDGALELARKGARQGK